MKADAYDSRYKLSKQKGSAGSMEEEMSLHELTHIFACAAGINTQPEQQPATAGEKNTFPSYRLNGTFNPLKWAHNELVLSRKHF